MAGGRSSTPKIRFLTPLTGPPAHPSASHLPASSGSAQVQLSKLDCTVDQLATISELYASTSPQLLNLTYTSTSPEEQLAAQSVLVSHGLRLSDVADLGSRWSIKWSQKWGKSSRKRVRLLVQCCCGYDTHARQERDRRNTAARGHSKSKSAHQPQSPSQPPPAATADSTGTPTLPSLWTRHAPYDFTGCLAHVEITYCPSDGTILRIHGYPHHNPDCDESEMKRVPPVPLHPHVYSVALKQLQDGADLMAIQTTNRSYIESQFYVGMTSPTTSKDFRYLIHPSDTSRLYRQNSMLMGVDTRNRPEVNVDEWLDPQSSSFKPQLLAAVHHYSARTATSERFQLCIASPEMEAATWKYGHKSQIILDGTFGVCDSRLLLFIVMGVDEENRGVPLAFLLFSAPAGNQQSSAGYNTEILTELLGKWSSWLERNGRKFKPLVAITDTDTKERGALLAVFPSILLLLCKFHLRQCWTNRRKSLKLVQTSGEDTFEMRRVRSRILSLEERLIESTDHATAMANIDAERVAMVALQRVHPSNAAASRAALSFLDYMVATWMPVGLWTAWSRAGRVQAAEVLGRPIDGVLPTTNHLESFNRILKRQHIRRWQKGGKRLRFDVFVHLLITRIIPSIFSSRAHLSNYKAWIQDRFSIAPLSDSSDTPTPSHSVAAVELHPPIAWINDIPSNPRVAQARELMERNHLWDLTYPAPTTLSARCVPTTSTPNCLQPSYLLSLQTNGFGLCSCPDFIQNSHRQGACKHLMALLLLTVKTRLSSPQNASIIPWFWLPANPATAYSIQQSQQPDDMPDSSIQSTTPSKSRITSTAPASTTSEVARALEDVLESTGTGLVGLDLEESTAGDGGDDELEADTDIEADVSVLWPLSASANSSNGLQEQLRVHVDATARKLTAQLRSFNHLVRETNLEKTSVLLELMGLADELHVALHARLPSETDSSDSVLQSLASNTCPPDSAPPPTLSTPLIRKQKLLPPSPEARQVRRDSWSAY